MHCDMLKIQDGVAIVEKLNCIVSVFCQITPSKHQPLQIN